MDVTPLVPAERQLIQAYSEHGFRVSGKSYTTSILVLPDVTIEWAVTEIGGVGIETLGPIIGTEPPVELLLLGCGARMALVPASLRNDLRARGIVVDAMDTGAACRTYNVLLGEERRVAAALIAITGAP